MSDVIKLPTFETELYDVNAPAVTLVFYRGGQEHRFTVPILEYVVREVGDRHDFDETIVQNGKVIA